MEDSVIRHTWVGHGLFPLIRPADTFSPGEKEAKRHGLKVHCASVCSSELGAPAGGLVRDL